MATPANSSTSRILIVDDHPLVRRGLIELINHEPDLTVCGEADGMPEALKLVAQEQPDLVIVDISLNTGNGIELIKQIRSHGHPTKMLVSTMHDESLFAERCLRAGAMGYINKEEATEKVIDAIRTVVSGKVYLSSRLAERMLSRMVGGEETLERSPIESLTDRELEVFGLIGRGLTTRQIGQKLQLSHKTIETYRENIKAKLNLKNAAELNHHAVQWSLEHS